MTQTPGEFIVVVWPGIPPITFPDHPKTEAAALQFIRAGNKVMYRQAGDNNVAPLTLDDGSAEYITAPPANGKTQTKRGRKASNKPALRKPAGNDGIAWKAGDSVYLAWSMLDDEQRLRHSKHRLTKGQVVETRSGQGVHYSTAVTFNGDPEPHWFKRRQLSQVPEAE